MYACCYDTYRYYCNITIWGREGGILISNNNHLVYVCYIVQSYYRLLRVHTHTHTHTHTHSCRSAFMFYSLAKRPEIKAQNPSFGVGKLAQRLAEHWRTMDATQKEPYAAKAREDRERYSVQLKAYKKGWGGGGAPQTLDSQKEAKDPEKERSPQEEDEGEEEEEEEGEEGGEEEEGEGKEGEGEVDKEAQLGGRVGVDSELEQLCEFYQ